MQLWQGHGMCVAPGEPAAQPCQGGVPRCPAQLAEQDEGHADTSVGGQLSAHRMVQWHNGVSVPCRHLGHHTPTASGTCHAKMQPC